MNIPISWLKEAANISDGTTALLEKLTNAGNAVESLATLGEDITNVVVGKIVSLTKHPDADKLWVTQTDIGTDVLQIITGADNLKEGDYIPVAVHGATLANGLKIKKGKMRGLDSNGMLCSIDELGYTTADFPEACADGIYVLQEPYQLGSDIRPILELQQEVADFDILSNRPDTNSVMGMAREAAAVYGQALSLPEIQLKENSIGTAADYVTVEIADTARCPRYIARVVQNVKVGVSPQWMRRRLTSAGVRPINNIVDITNYVMLEYGQPLHAFDISAVAEKNGKRGIVVRTAFDSEKITTLDGEERKLSNTTLLITDQDKAIGIAGVMGGENSKITNSTTTILFESANFESANIRQTSRFLGIRTDASGRYEKGQDPEQALISVNRAMELVELLNCGDVVPGMVDAYPVPAVERVVQFKPCGICTLLGVPTSVLGPAEICGYLQNVDIATQLFETYIEATIPTHRADITCEADLAEEVARFYGFNNIESRYEQITTPSSGGSGPLAAHEAGKTTRRRRQDTIKRSMVALGYNEAMTYPFESPKVFDKLGIPANDVLRNAIRLQKPLGEDFSIMRTVPLDGLLESVARNYNKGNDNVALFEIAQTYAHGSPYIEKTWLTLVAYGSDMDYLAIKGDVEALLSTVTNRPNHFAPASDIPYMHPGRTAAIAVKTSQNPRDEAVPLGVVGELHPSVAKNYDIDARVFVAMLEMDALHQVAEAYKFKFANPAMYPAITRDLAFKVEHNVPAADLEAAIREKGGQYFAEVKLFDVYQGAQVGEGYKSMAYSLKFRANDKTLTVPDVQHSIDAILVNLQKKYGAEIRG